MSTELKLDPSKVTGNTFIGKTDREPRPTWDKPFGPGGQEALKADQARWDFAKAWDADNKKQRSDFLANLDATKRADEQTRRDADDARVVDQIRKQYFGADRTATEDEFQRDLPEIRRQARIAAALKDQSNNDKANGINRAKYVL